MQCASTQKKFRTVLTHNIAARKWGAEHFANNIYYAVFIDEHVCTSFLFRQRNTNCPLTIDIIFVDSMRVCIDILFIPCIWNVSHSLFSSISNYLWYASILFRNMYVIYRK